MIAGYELEALMVAHDGVISTLPPDTTVNSSPQQPSQNTIRSTVSDHRYGEDNIKIIKIEKSTEPLGATVKSEGDAVIIGKLKYVIHNTNIQVLSSLWPRFSLKWSSQHIFCFCILEFSENWKPINSDYGPQNYSYNIQSSHTREKEK